LKIISFRFTRARIGEESSLTLVRYRRDVLRRRGIFYETLPSNRKTTLHIAYGFQGKGRGIKPAMQAYVDLAGLIFIAVVILSAAAAEHKENPRETIQLLEKSETK
jgi:hypothetical protein